MPSRSLGQFGLVPYTGVAYLHDCWVLLTAFDEFIECQFSIFVTVHVFEDLVHSLLGIYVRNGVA